MRFGMRADILEEQVAVKKLNKSGGVTAAFSYITIIQSFRNDRKSDCALCLSF